METMSASACPPRTPQTQLSHVRETRPRPPIGSTQQATRSMQAADSHQPPLSAPASQESMLSADSYGSSTGPRLQSSSSNLSQLTSYTDLTSPTTSAPGSQALDISKNPEIARVRTPQERNGTIGHGMDALASPMSISTPMSVNGTKRTASGHVKQSSVSLTPLTSALGGSRSRAESTSSTGSRAGELAANLKARLGYAMTKVHHGWEHKTFDEVEQLAAAEKAAKRHTMLHVDYSKRPVSAGLSNGTSRLSMYEGYGDGVTSPPSKRHSGSYAAYGHSYYHQPGPRLQPAPELRPTNGVRGYHTAHPSQHSVASSAMSPPRTPNAHPRRPPVLRTDTQTAEAERDALQALFQLGSPHASQVSRHTNNASQASSSQASPLRAEFATPRRVTFARSESLDSSSAGARPSSSEGSERH